VPLTAGRLTAGVHMEKTLHAILVCNGQALRSP
jgi:hypothetical protein